MLDKPATLEGYSGEYLRLVRSVCLYAATVLGDLLDDLVVVGGLAPSLLIDQSELPIGLDAHLGTRDLDLGLALSILEEERYEELSVRLRDAGFAPDVNDQGNVTNQRWRHDSERPITIDFLIPPSGKSDRGGTLRHLQQGFAAVITPGLHLAFADRRRVEVSGRTPSGEEAVRAIWVCGPGALLVLKALAFRNRGANKDAYDFSYVLRGIGGRNVSECLRPFLEDPHVKKAVAIIRQDFATHDGLGPRRVANFLTNGPDDDIQADVVGDVLAFLQEIS